MRYLLIIALALSGMTFLAPQAEAGGYRERSYGGHHHHRHYRHYPSRRVVYRSHYHRPSYYRPSYYAPVVYGGGYYDNCYPRYRHYSRPRIAVSFGF